MSASDRLEQLIEEIAEATRRSTIGVGAKATVAVRLAEAHAWLAEPLKPHAPRQPQLDSGKKVADG